MATTNPKFQAYRDNYGNDKTIANGLKNGIVTDSDIKLIMRYVTDKQSECDISPGRERSIVGLLVQARRFIPCEYQALNLECLKAGRRNLNNGKKDNGEPLSPNYKRNMLKEVKMFARRLGKWGIIPKIDSDDLKEIKPAKANYDSITPDMVLSASEIQQLINACQNSRDRFFISLFYETGARIQEIASLQWSDIIMSGDYDVMCNIFDIKTKKRRPCWIVASIPYYLTYKHDMFGNEQPPAKNFLLTNVNGKRTALSPSNCRKILITAAQRAGIQKHIMPKLFRTSRVVNMHRENFPDAVVRDQIWGNQDTGMYKHYLKWDNADSRNVVKAKAGIIKQEQQQEVKPAIETCPKCNRINTTGDPCCAKCGYNFKTGTAGNSSAATIAAQQQEIDDLKSALAEIRAALRK